MDISWNKEYYCPECGEQVGSFEDVFIFEASNSIVGCSACLRTYNAQEWFEEIEEQARLLSKNYEEDCFVWGSGK